jgi:uncharacterized protein (TIGR00369 family)
MSETMTVQQVQEIVGSRPYHQWLGLEVQALHNDGVEIKAKWREEWIVNPQVRYTHGGILATLIDIAADYALVNHTRRGVPTIDMRVDYHAPAMPGDLIARGTVVKLGRQFSVAEASVFDEKGTLLASGRGTYLTAPPKS